MLLPRRNPIHPRLRCILLLRDFHATRARLRKLLHPSQIELEPTTAKVKKLPSLKSNGRKSKKLMEKKRKERKPIREERLSSTAKPSSLPRFNNKSARYPRTVEGADGLNTLPGQLGASEKDVSDGDRGNKPLLPSSLLYSRRVDGVIQPRASQSPFLEDVVLPFPQNPIATLAHGLDRVLFSPGVQWLQDPRSQVYGFTTWLEKIIPVKNFAFERLPPFLPSSRDQDLYAVAQRERRKYAGSTSSLSGLLCQLYFLISGDKRIDTSNLSGKFNSQPQTFSPSQRAAASVILNYRDGVYLIDSAGDAVPGLSGKNVLTWMGTLMEKLLTRSPEEFLRLTRSFDNPVVMTKEPKQEAYRYAKSDKFALRSQLDCFDHRLPGTGVFDIKTRAVMTIRHDLLNFEEGSGYQIHTLQGLVESFEKEYYDLIRSGFLKYSFQARIGNMDGVFVAYHNTERIFGFQYIPLSEMDARLFGEDAAGDVVFEKCLQLLEVVLEEATRELPQQSIRLTAQKKEGQDSLSVFLEPATPDEELEGESCPVIQLDVSTKSFIDERATSGTRAVTRSNRPWTLLWSISKSTLDPQIIRKNLAATRKGSFFPFYLPTGVSIREMEKVWHGMQFNPVAPTEVPFKAELFRSAPTSIHLLRRLSRMGRDYIERTMRKQQGRPKVVLNLPNDAQVVAPRAALAHGPGLVQSVVDNNTSTTLLTDLGYVRGPIVSSDVQTGKPIIAEAAHQQASGGGAHIPEGTITHLEDMLSEDQRRMAEEQAAFSAIQSERARSMLSRPPYTNPGTARHHSKSRQLVNHLQRRLREAETFDTRAPAAQEEHVHEAEV